MHIRNTRYRWNGTIHCDEVRQALFHPKALFPHTFTPSHLPLPEAILTLGQNRELYMKSGQGFLLVFSITSLSSLTELHELRDQIVRIKDDSNVPLVIVGNKSDLEEDRAVSRSRAFSVSQSWNNAPYYETSARRRANVDEAFVDLCRQIIRKDVATRQVREMERGLPREKGGSRGRGGGGRRPKRRKWAEDVGKAKMCNIL